ncbi:hypothetical protein EDC14_103152 [Hydrogenispora ethanolica]|jgi:hypothetical protein|uniref:Uncharacterized protein n=1 Tax=Hydrogenispora ethanolica TaxID=1082276 RepID=A0A4R1R8K0_HYDET|nr:hypothetical protein EDC14_103152 [Hydrogenispora ethanolica]
MGFIPHNTQRYNKCFPLESGFQAGLFLCRYVLAKEEGALKKLEMEPIK